MNSPLDTESSESPHPAGSAVDIGEPLPRNWREALLALIASRVSLIQLEGKDAAKAGASKAIACVAIVICVFFTWALLLAGGIAAISSASGWPWHWIALVASAVHLLAALILVHFAKRPGPATFTATKAEFHKDREWIENFQKTRKSNG
jgi:Putative Actinobacterial Holin-X, holin superfamily III